jgi:hypothetical protein
MSRPVTTEVGFQRPEKTLQVSIRTLEVLDRLCLRLHWRVAGRRPVRARARALHRSSALSALSAH